MQFYFVCSGVRKHYQSQHWKIYSSTKNGNNNNNIKNWKSVKKTLEEEEEEEEEEDWITNCLIYLFTFMYIEQMLYRYWGGSRYN